MPESLAAMSFLGDWISFLHRRDKVILLHGIILAQLSYWKCSAGDFARDLPTALQIEAYRLLTILVRKTRLFKNLGCICGHDPGLLVRSLNVWKTAFINFKSNLEGNSTMSKKTLLDPKNPFSPGELVLLNGEIFAKKVMMGNFQLMHTDASVSYAQLGDAILTSAFLAIESTKDLRFEIRAEKAMLGLRKVKSVYVQKTSNENLWPEYSPEFQFLNIMEVFDKDGENAKVSDLIYSWLQQDSSSPWQSVIAMVQSGLAERSLLEKTETTRLKVFTTANYSLPESTAELVKEFSINPIQEMMNNYQENRSEFWDLLKKENKKAIKQRTAQDDMDFD